MSKTDALEMSSWPATSGHEEPKARIRRVPERRNRERLELHVSIALLAKGREFAVGATTTNLGLGGLYCVSREAFKPGEELTTFLRIPHHSTRPDAGLELECRLRVLRLERWTASPDAGSPAGEFGMACRIEHYQVVRGDAAGRTRATEFPASVEPAIRYQGSDRAELLKSG
jgi:hypothetical protein